jgi:hypothetical protein
MAALVLVLSGSCSTDIDIIHESSGRPVAYCLLNPQDSVQYLRVSRSFIIRGNPFEQDIPPDSLVLDEDFYAYLVDETPAGHDEPHYFAPTTIHLRDSGFFPREDLVVLETPLRVEGGNTYGLYIHFPGITRLVAGSATVVEPSEILDPIPLPGRELTLSDEQGYLVRWSNHIPFSLFEPVIRFIYLEGDKNSQVEKELDLPQPVVYGNADATFFSSYLNGAGFIADLVKNLNPPDSGIRRKIIGFDLLLNTGGTEMGIYERSGQNTINAFTGLDEYSNLDGAVGLYSSRTQTATYNNRFSDLTINLLADDKRTHPLGFLRYDEDFTP